MARLNGLRKNVRHEPSRRTGASQDHVWLRWILERGYTWCPNSYAGLPEHWTTILNRTDRNPSSDPHRSSARAQTGTPFWEGVYLWGRRALLPTHAFWIRTHFNKCRRIIICYRAAELTRLDLHFTHKSADWNLRSSKTGHTARSRRQSV